MSETAEAPVQTAQTTATDNSSVRARMVEKANATRAAIIEKKPEVKADTVAQVTEAINTTTSKVDDASSQAKAAEQMALNNAKIEAEKKDVEASKAIISAQVAESKLAEATKEKEWYETEGAQSEIKAELKSEQKTDPDYEAKLKAYEELTNDKFIEAYTTAKKAGKNITSFIKEVAPLDVEAIPAEKLYELSLSSAGLTPEEKEVEMDAFQNLTPLQKKRAVNEVKESLLKEESQKLAKYITDNKVDQAKQEQFLGKYQSEKSEFLSKLKEKEYMGLKLNQSDIDQALQYVEHGFPTTREDGSYNLPTMFELAVFRNKKKEISQNLINKGISLGREAVLKELSRTDRNDGAGKVLPDVTNQNKNDQAKDIMRKKFGR